MSRMFFWPSRCASASDSLVITASLVAASFHSVELGGSWSTMRASGCALTLNSLSRVFRHGLWGLPAMRVADKEIESHRLASSTAGRYSRDMRHGDVGHITC